MEDGLVATILGFIYPVLVIIFWALVLAAIIWGVVKIVKKLTGKKSDK